MIWCDNISCCNNLLTNILLIIYGKKKRKERVQWCTWIKIKYTYRYVCFQMLEIVQKMISIEIFTKNRFGKYRRKVFSYSMANKFVVILVSFGLAFTCCFSVVKFGVYEVWLQMSHCWDATIEKFVSVFKDICVWCVKFASVMALLKLDNHVGSRSVCAQAGMYAWVCVYL